MCMIIKKKPTSKSTRPATLFSSSLRSCSEKTASWASETRPLGFCIELGLGVGVPDFVVPTTEDHGLADEVLLVVVVFA